jgi:glycosyltransferase involved in cell wall biosynthesis
VLLEAMACGVPVVATRVGGNPEVVRTARVGTLVDFWDAEGFAGALSEALGRDWDRPGISREAGRHGWEARIDALERIFRSVSRRPDSANRGSTGS